MNSLKSVFAAVGWLFVATNTIIFLAVLVLFLGLVKTGMSSTKSASVKSDRAVGVVEIVGEIISSTKVEKDLKEFLENEKIKAIVVRIDSPGGTVGASEEIFRLIKNASEKKPIVCSMASVAASGGLYAASGCRKVLANAGTITGSIGVVLMYPNVNSILDRFGLQMSVVKSGQYKDVGSPFRPMEVGDTKLLQQLVDQAHEQFVGIVAQGRGLSIEKVSEFADGRVLLGDEAMKLGLVDAIGGVEEAAKEALTLAKLVGEPEIIRKEEPIGFKALLEGSFLGKIQSMFQLQTSPSIRYQAFLP